MNKACLWHYYYLAFNKFAMIKPFKKGLQNNLWHIRFCFIVPAGFFQPLYSPGSDLDLQASISEIQDTRWIICCTSVLKKCAWRICWFHHTSCEELQLDASLKLLRSNHYEYTLSYVEKQGWAHIIHTLLLTHAEILT